MSDKNTEWCAGLAFVSQRPLDEEERRCLISEARRDIGWGVATALAFLFILGIIPAVIYLAPSIGNDIMDGLIVPLGLVMLVGLVAAGLISFQLFVSAKQVRKDLKNGYLKKYAGAGSKYIERSRKFSELRKLNGNPDVSNGVWIEVLPLSNRVWTYSEQRVRSWIVAESYNVADQPAFAELAAQWLEPFAQNDDSILLYGRREMTTTEKAELKSHIRKIGWIGLRTLILFTICMAYFIQSLVLEAHDWLFLILFAILLFRINIRRVKLIKRSFQLKKDLRLGYLVIFRSESKAVPVCGAGEIEEVKGEDHMEAPSKSPQTFELLPFTRTVWSTEGHPAGWRVHPSLIMSNSKTPH